MNTDSSRMTVGAGATVTINDADFNFDGGGGPTNQANVESGGLLDLNLGAGAEETFDNTITLNSGSLSVTTISNSWTVDRALNLNNSTGVNPIVSGETLNLGSDTETVDADLIVTGAGVSRRASTI